MVTRLIGRLFNLLLLAALLASSFLLPSRVHAGGGGGITVNTTQDNTTTNSLCSLREAITNSNDDAATYPDCGAGVPTIDLISFDAGLGYATITLTSNLPSIVAGNIVTIAAANHIIIHGNDLYRPFYVSSGATLNLQNLIISHGYYNASGGGLTNAGTTSLTRVTFASNTADGSAGGVFNTATLTVVRSTFLGNFAGNDGGAIDNFGTTANATISNSTFAINTANYGGAVLNNSGTLNILSSTFSANNATNPGGTGGAIATWTGSVGNTPTTQIHNSILANSTNGDDCNNDGGGALTGGNNLIESTADCGSIASLTSDPKLGLLKGAPAYYPLQDGSPAINAGDDIFCAALPVNNTSQNGIPRPQGAHCDIGSMESPVRKVFRSVGIYDGWVLESTATSSVGGSMNTTATTVRVGDEATRNQYRSILSFTTSGIPDTAILTGAKLRVKVGSTMGTGNPVTLLGGFMADVRKGPFGLPSLQITDFQAAASKTVGPTSPSLVSNWYTINLYAARSYVNKLTTNSGVTQVRLRFKMGDNGNSSANYLTLFSGNAFSTIRPQLIVYYYVP
jgi:CSLREA domain-containing protein